MQPEKIYQAQKKHGKIGRINLKNKKTLQEKAKASTPPSVDEWADEPRLFLERTTAIAEADHKAYSIFEKEKKRLSEIAMIWEGIIQSKKRNAQMIREEVAQAYLQGDEVNWNDLIDEERASYEHEMRVANEATNTEILATIEQAIQTAKSARAQVRVTPSDLFIKAAEKAQVFLHRLQGQENERKMAIEIGKWLQKTSEERKAELESPITRVQEKIATSVSNEQASWQKALDYWNQAIKADANNEYENFLIWRKAAKHAEAAAKYYHEATESSENNDNADLWREAAEQSDALAQRYAQIILLLDSEEERKQLNSLDQFAEQSMLHLEEAEHYLKNAAAVNNSRKTRCTDVYGLSEGSEKEDESSVQSEKKEEMEKESQLTSHEQHPLEAPQEEDFRSTPPREVERGFQKETAKLWRLAAEQTQKLASYESQIRELDFSAEEKQNNIFHDAHFALTDAIRLESADCLKQSIAYLIKAAQNKNAEARTLWVKAAEQMEDIATKCYEAEQAPWQTKPSYNVIDSFFEGTKNIASAAKYTEKKLKQKLKEIIKQLINGMKQETSC
jgi:hypothetical protein